MENAKTEYLNPRRRLVDEVAEWLCAKVRADAGGAKSLGHLMVVVPTAQSGRQLRLRLAREAQARGWGGILPPQVVLPMQLVRPADGTLATASTVQLRAAFLAFVARPPRQWPTLVKPEFLADFRSHLAFLDQLGDIWRVLAGGGLLMRDVAARIRANDLAVDLMDNERERWDELGDFETAFFDFLHAHGLRHEAEGVRLAKTAATPLPDDVEEVVLPALVDPVSVLFDVLGQQRASLKVRVLVHAEPSDAAKFDGWGRPLVKAWTGSSAPVLAGIRNEDVVRAATEAELARRVAVDFPAPDSGCALPSLGLCDEEVFPELAAAFLVRGYELHNPERHPIAVSSLGRMIDNLVALHGARREPNGYPWDAFVALLREPDVMGPVKRLLPRDAKGNFPTREEILEGLDVCRNAFLPRTMPWDCMFDLSRLKRFQAAPCATFCRAAKALVEMLAAAQGEGASAAGFVRAMLLRLYAHRPLGTDEGSREFQAAAHVVRDVLDAFDDSLVSGLGLSEGALAGLFRKTVAEAAYSLEPGSKSAVRTEGWLELAWSACDKVALAGFHEGAVPDSVMGHAFLPDSLRMALGLTSNEQRLARDTCLLKDILAARASAPGSVRAYVAQTNGAGDIRRPSRLLFLVGADALAARVKRLFGELPPGEGLPGRRIAAGWGLSLPSEVEPHGKTRESPDGNLSASAIDTWLKCPFTYLFDYGLGMRRVEEKSELGADDFGTLVHKALELYALEQLERTERGLCQLHELGDIQASIASVVDRLRQTYGAAPSVNLRLQIDAAAGRLMDFARLQARWAADGWVVAARPEYDFRVRPFEGEAGCDIVMKGSVDRIDYKDGVGYRLIDYKTWDRKGGATGRIVKGGSAQAEHAARLRLPTLADGRRFLSVQLPLYGLCLQKADPDRFAGRIADFCYVILGRTPEETAVLGSADDQGPFEAYRKADKLKLVEQAEVALDTARAAVRRIRANVFWPPGPSEDWRWDVKDVLQFSPARELAGTAWLKGQEAKLAALAEGGAK